MMNKIRFGIIGTNFIADWIVSGGKQDGRFEVSAVYSRTKEKGDAFANKHNISKVFVDLEQMAESTDIDAIYISSPNAFHCKQALLCLNHKKHVLCEKPLASNAAEVREMIEMARRQKVVLMEAMKSTLTPGFLVVQKSISQLGLLRHYFASFCQYSSRYDKLKEGIVLNAFQPELSNGALMDIGVYCIYPMIVLFGRPKRVSASAVLLSSGVDGQGTINFEYENGLLGTVVYSKIHDSTVPSAIHGEDGYLQLDRINKILNVNLVLRKGVVKVGGGGGTPSSSSSCSTSSSVTSSLPSSTVTPVVAVSGSASTALPVDMQHDEYYYEIAEFITLVQKATENKKESGAVDVMAYESRNNSLENSLITAEVMEEVRKQIGVVYPADKEIV